MSESANIRQNLQSTPSIFEITAADTLDSLIYPALNKLFDYFGLRLDFKLWHWHIQEEVSPILTWALQYLYLRNRSASFGESFYGLERIVTVTGNPLTTVKQLTSASFLTLLPYLERQLRTRNMLHAIDTSSNMWEKYMLKLFNAYRASKAICTFLYLIKYIKSHSPILPALGLTLRTSTKPQNDKASIIFLKLLEVMAFFLQFIQWWYSNGQRRKIGGLLRNPRPMTRNVAEKVKDQDLPSPNYCPVCLMQIANPTACAVSGYVYCWKCIVTYLKKYSKCPVTGYAISLDDLVRIH